MNQKHFGIMAIFALILLLIFTACPLEPNPTHTHDYATTWSKNATQHWHECSCGEKTDVADHIGDPCTVCGYSSGNPGPSPTDTVKSVTVTMTNPSPFVVKGSAVTFTATVEGPDNPDQTVTWSVDGTSGTSITADGILTVATDETAFALTIKAASTHDPTKFGTLAVMVVANTAAAAQKDFTVGAADFPIVMKSICDKPGTYTVTLTEDVINYHGVLLEPAGVKITVKGDGHKITWKHDSSVDVATFDLRDGHLVLEDIQLSHAEDTENKLWGLIGLVGGGTVEVKDGVILTGDGKDTNTGIYLDGGTFIMSGGEISGFGNGIIFEGNGTTATVSGGTFINNWWSGIGFWEAANNNLTISGGTFKDNESAGVTIHGSRNTVTVTGGTFSGNANGVNIQGSGNTITVTGGTFRDNSWGGINFWEATNCILTISEGTFENNENGVGIQGTGNTVTITGGTFSNNIYHGIWVASTNCVLTIEGGSFKDNGVNGVGIGVSGNTVTITGGTFEDNGNGVSIDGSGDTVTITGGTFSGNSWNGVTFWEATNCILTIEGGTFEDNQDGVEIHGSGNTVTISGGEISNNEYGVTFWEATNCILAIKDGANISSNDKAGIVVWTENWNNTITMSGGEIKDNKSDRDAVAIKGENCNFIMDGGSIGGNAGWGLVIEGPGSGFEKKTGAIIYGDDAGNNSNGGAIWVLDSLLSRTAASEEVFAAKLNDDGDGIVPGSLVPEKWD